MSKERTEFTENLKWNIKDLYPSATEWKENCDYIEKKIPELLKYKGHILDNSNNLYEVLNLDNELSQKLERAYIYAHINSLCFERRSYYEIDSKRKQVCS